ncbi:helix-turn-helix domain-containing protein [Bacillus sp. ISL-47]|uniref:helix-turn-helix domain-containing protein n=1 Tax=Bacillus sp. ISL-47 TaxID=2819130 RepID=UPI001BE623A1|nr:helix-turn-helix domain-containing protein [Bacillus sp. ISL-47]MBT2687406.1 helix-turn-helix domain-containing protein [Bacillus sp. ISL-47]MBT2707132.1 helix-turn-helix domain-containing protein [Pseudomonas sp. ISL-84]
MTIMQEKISSLLEINRSLTQSLDLEEILKKLVEAAFDLVENADTTILYKLKDDGLLHFSQGVGVDAGFMSQVKFEPGESLTGLVFLTKKGVIASGHEFREHMSRMSETNYVHFFNGVFRREVKSGILVPLVYKEECIGVLVVDNFDKDVQFTEDEFHILEVVADQAAIAIMNSKLYEEVKRKNNELSHSLDIHRRFTKILLEGRGVSYILETISHILGTPVTYAEIADEKSSSFPIISSNELFGYFLLKMPIESLTSIQRAALEHAATALSLEFVKQNTLFEKEMHLREEAFHDIINDTRLNQRVLEKYQLNEKSRVSCMIIDCKAGFLWDARAILQKEKLIKSLEQVLMKYSETSIVFTKSDQIVALLVNGWKNYDHHLAEEIQKFMTTNKQAVIGLGREVALTEIADSYQEATEAVSYCKNHKHKTFVTYSELGAERLWLNMDRSLLKKFVSDKMGSLLQMEPEYLQTMQAFLANNKSHKKTAEEMHIHPNTLTYRLKKIENQLDMDFNKKDDWIAIVLAFQIFDYLTP